MAIPKVESLAAKINLESYALIVGDDDEVASKWKVAYQLITEFVQAMHDSGDEINAAVEAIRVILPSIPDLVPTTVDIAGAARGSGAYNAALGTAVSSLDVRTGRELVITGISGAVRTTDVFWAEYGPSNVPRWAGPLTPADPPLVAPTVDAGPDASVEQNDLFERTGIATTTDATIVAWEWKISTTVIGTTETLRYRPTTVGTYTVSLTVTDSNRQVSTADTFQLTVAAVASLSEYDLAAQPSGDPAVKITTNSTASARLLQSSARQAFLANNARIVVSRSAPGATDPDVSDVIDLSGNVRASSIRIEREPLASYLDANRVYGVWDYAQGEAFAHTQYAQRNIELVYNAQAGLTVGSGRGRQSFNDRYVVVRRESDSYLFCLDLQQNSVIAAMASPAWYRWVTITPDSRHILLGGTNGVWRYTRSFLVPTQISTSNEYGDCVMADDGYSWFVQTGATARAIEVHTGSATNINTFGAAVSGQVSGASLVPNYVCASWRVGSDHEVITMDLSDGAAMWENRIVWTNLPAGVETREWATPAATPSQDGRMILYRSSVTPGSGVVDLYLVK